jgi:predicted small metal-binding protein
MRVLDCECGHTLQAANDEDLFKVARAHVDDVHKDTDMSDEQVRDLIADKAYSATDS